MKFFFVCLLAVNLGRAADFVTGQAARLVIGQTTFTSQEQGASQTLLGGVGGLAYANDMLVVADANRVAADPANHRVLLFTNLSLMLPRPTDELPYTQKCPVCGGAASLVLGQPDFTETAYSSPPTAQSFRTPTAVATDGVMLAVADSDNNRVLIWRSLPSVNQAPPDVVVGQSDFQSNAVARPPTASSLLGPQGVWIQDGRLLVADTLNHRVLIWNSIPASSGQAADVVLGQPNFNTLPETEPVKAWLNAKATTLFSPVSVTSDGQRLYVTDLGYDRVLIWNSMPTTNQQPADVVIGQPDMTTVSPNNVTKLCQPTGKKDDQGNDLYPKMCSATLDTPRYALSDGKRLFIADGGNDRVLVFSQVPTANGQSADVILGQPAGDLNQASDSAFESRRSSADSLRTPLSLAWDGTNLYVSDPFNRRVMVFTVAENAIPLTGIRNSASISVHAVGAITFSGSIQAGDEVTVTIGDKDYTYKLLKDDTTQSVISTLVQMINAGDGDPLVYAAANFATDAIVVTARNEGAAGNDVTYAVKSTAGASFLGTTVGTSLTRGEDAAMIAPGTLVSILGDNLADQTAAAPPDADPLPTELGGVQVYFNGIRSPLLYVSPTQINAQVPFEMFEVTSMNAYVRVRWNDGRVTATNAVGVPIVGQNPGIFALQGPEPRAGVVLHYSSYATATISLDGSATTGEVDTVIIEDREYSYTAKEGDTLFSIRDGLVDLINQDPRVEAFPSGYYSRIRLKARIPGPEGNGIQISVRSATNGSLLLTPFNESLCCANEGGSLVTEENPALPGETIVLYATGLGIVNPLDAQMLAVTGEKYKGPELNDPVTFVSAVAGDKTASVLSSGLKPGWVGVYEVHLELNTSQPTNSQTQVYIGQSQDVSNIVTVPIYNPDPTAQ
jgi:hypothetical protein